MARERRWYLPREVAELLGVPPSTLRTYAANFGALLSDRARPDEGGGKGFRHRRYDDADLRLLREAKELLDAGMSYQAALARLGGGAFARAAAPKQRRPSRAKARSAPAPLPPTPASAISPAPRPEPPPPVVVAGIDELRGEIQSLRAELARSRSTPAPAEHSMIEPAVIEGIATQLQRIQARLDNLEAQITALATPTPRPGWLARLFRRA